jgi:hypothetical protein
MAGLYLSFAMLAPAAVDFYFGNPDWQVFAVSSFAVGSICLATAAANRGINAPFSRRLGFLVVNLLWITLSVTGAIPFYMASLGLDMADALFESVSAVTTTGATVISRARFGPSRAAALALAAAMDRRNRHCRARPARAAVPEGRRLHRIQDGILRHVREALRALQHVFGAFFAIYIGLTQPAPFFTGSSA